MAIISVASIPLSNNDISSLAQLLAVPLQYYCDHQSPFEKDYQKQLSTIAGLGFTTVLVDGNLLPIYQPHLSKFIASLRGGKIENLHALASATAHLASATIHLNRFHLSAYYPVFVNAVKEAITHVTVQQAGKLEEAKKLLGILFPNSTLRL